MNFILGIIQSIISSFLFNWFGTERKSRSKDAFQERTKLFHEKISPYLLDFVISEMAPDLKNKLVSFSHKGQSKLLPFVDLASDKDIKISDHLHTTKKKYKTDNELIDWLKNVLEKNVYDSPTFTVDGISSNSVISVGIGSYFANLSTSDIHYYNLIRYFPLNAKRGAYFSYRHGKYVSRWLESLREITLNNNYNHYCASIACSVLTVVKSSDGKYKYVIKENSTSKGSSALDRHVVPSFMFQPISNRLSEQERELDLRLSVYREFGEELLGLKELESAVSVDALLAHIQSNSLLAKLISDVETGDATIEKTGFILDVYRLRPEFTFLLIINDDKYSEALTANWEMEQGAPLDFVELHDIEAYKELIFANKTPLCAPGLAALINGRDRALELLSLSG